MAVRNFDGTADFIDFDVPAGLDIGLSAFTLLYVIKRNANGTWDCLSSHMNAGGGTVVTPELSNANNLSIECLVTGSFTGGNSSENGAPGTGTPFTVVAADGWVILAMTKALGADRARFHVYKGGTWSRTNSALIWGNSESHVGGTIRIGRYGAATGDDGDFRMAAMAIWKGTALTDANLNGINGGNAATLNALGVSELFEFDQASIATPVAGRKGVVTQEAISGTSVITGDDPPSTVYTMGASLVSGTTYSKSGLSIIGP